MSSERAREREVHRYYQTWLDSSCGYNHDATSSADTRHHRDGTTLRPSNDKALIAFAQLGCMRLGVKRGIVSLISNTRQYILAEATRSLSLETGFPEEDEDDELWFGNASLPRSQGLSAGALHPPQYTASDSKGRQHTAAALVIPDLLEHPEYKKYPVAGNGVSFYCGVPIVSRAGYHIGTYSVNDDKPRDGVSRTDLIFMEEMARIIMAHLQVVFNDAARYRGEKLVTGLGQFLEGRLSMRDQAPREPASAREGAPDIIHQDVTRQFKGMSITNADPGLLRQIQTSSTDETGQSSTMPSGPNSAALSHVTEAPRSDAEHADTVPNGVDHSLSSAKPNHSTTGSTKLEPSSLQRVFGRAATILRQCTSADGVIFFDATSTNVTKRCGTSEFDDRQEGTDGASTIVENSTSDTSGTFDYSSNSTESDGPTGDERSSSSSKQKCQMLGYALDVSAASTANTSTIHSLGLTERVLRRFIRRYPRGKVFYFTEGGEISASENENSEGGESSDASNYANGGRQPLRAVTERMIANELIHAMPGARNIVWLPLWDFAKQRWSAGTFVWSRRPERLLAAQDDLTYLKTFGNSIMIDLARIDAQSADEAKATFIANISHELRSPLHGILGSTEFLQETALDGFQSAMARAVETCAKTLLDTVEHVLDYSKINQMSNKLSKKQRRRLHRKSSELSSSGQSMVAPSLVNDVDLASILEEAVEAIYAGQTFRSASQNEDVRSVSRDFTTLRKKVPLVSTDVESAAAAKGVRLLLEIEKSDKWRVRTQPGAIRRIVMNIVGNALKYTDRGTITIFMSGKDEFHNGVAYKTVCLQVRDTGVGMSKMFLHNHAFTPFSQESYLSTGTGLGLSIVRQIVSSLGGRIELDSEKNVGTEVTVNVRLPQALSSPPSDSYDNILQSVVEQTSGMSMCILTPDLGDVQQWKGNPEEEAVRSALHSLATTWFGLKITQAASMNGQVTDFFIYPEPPSITYLLRNHGHAAVDKEVPVIIITTNAFESASLVASGVDHLTELGRIVEIVCQPCGPHKLARALQRCLARLSELEIPPETAQLDSPVDTRVIERTGQASQHLPNAVSEQLDYESTPTESHFTGHEAPGKTERRPSLVAGFTERRSFRRSPPMASAHLSSQFEPREQSLCTSTPASPLAITPLSEFPLTQRLPAILLVDDNLINLQLLVAFVKKSGHPYLAVENGLEATQAFEDAMERDVTGLPPSSEHTPSINGAANDNGGILGSIDDKNLPFKYIVMDISMPVMNGIEATRLIRQMERRRGIRQGEEKSAVIIALTGLGVETTRNEMLNAGADYYLCKPIKFRDLKVLFDEGNAVRPPT